MNPCFSVTIPGAPAGKKNTSRVTYPGIASAGLRWQGKPVRGLKAAFQALALLARNNPGKAASIMQRLSGRSAPVIQPSKDHQRWYKEAEPVARRAVERLREQGVSTPIIPHGHLARVQAIFYRAKGQRGDFVNFLQAVDDLLEDVGVVPTDYWINSHDGSSTEWDEPFNPRVEIEVYDLGRRPASVEPSVRVEGLDAANESLGSLEFYVEGPDERRVEGLSLPRGSSRSDVVHQAARSWWNRWDEKLPGGSRIVTGRRAPEDTSDQPESIQTVV